MNTKITNKNTKAIRSLNESDVAARELFRWFSERKKASRSMPVRVAAFQTDQSEAKIRRVFKALEELECGKFLKGSRGHESRMEWRVNILSLARVAKGEESEIENAIPETGETLEQEASASPKVEDGYIMHSFTYRKGEAPLQVMLPENLARSEADRLASFIKSLPFEE